MRKLMLLLSIVLLAHNGNALSGSDFDKLKTLVGEWEGTSPEGKSRITFQLISNGTALMETLGADSENMVTIYHRDGDTILMTHYCAIGNQPRMRARDSGGGNSINFQLVDTSNLKESVGHMQRLVIKFQDADRVVEEWTWKDKGEEKTSVFQLRRVK
jgi:hypothetical protein